MDHVELNASHDVWSLQSQELVHVAEIASQLVWSAASGSPHQPLDTHPASVQLAASGSYGVVHDDPEEQLLELQLSSVRSSGHDWKSHHAFNDALGMNADAFSHGWTLYSVSSSLRSRCFFNAAASSFLWTFVVSRCISGALFGSVLFASRTFEKSKFFANGEAPLVPRANLRRRQNRRRHVIDTEKSR